MKTQRQKGARERKLQQLLEVNVYESQHIDLSPERNHHQTPATCLQVQSMTHHKMLISIGHYNSNIASHVYHCVYYVHVRSITCTILFDDSNKHTCFTVFPYDAHPLSDSSRVLLWLQLYLCDLFVTMGEPFSCWHLLRYESSPLRCFA